MSSSDEDWMPQMRPVGLNAGTGHSAMMDARRRALQRQREAQRRQEEQQQPPPPTTDRRETTTTAAAAPAKKAESSLPDFLAGLDDDEDNNAFDRTAPATLHSPSQPTQIFPVTGTSSSNTAAAAVTSTPSLSQQTHEATVEELQREIAAKKKLLQSTKEREAALIEKWRVTKAQKQAEVEQLNGKIRRVWAAIEDEKSAAETKLREAQDQHESELRAARRRVEQEVKAEYDTRIAEAQKQLCSAMAEEERLRQLLEDKSGCASAKDTVNTALTAAITAVMLKLDDVFQSEGADGLHMEAWKSELQTLVQREIQTSFAVGVESETQAERDEYQRFFSEMLAFWRNAEDQERERLLKMDETLLSDLQSMAQQDLKRLQDEELTMERVYVESREAWAVEHQKLLQRELEGALQRREGELQENRRQRHELHVERLRDADERHKDMMAKEEALHQQRMEQVRAFFHREEALRAEQQRVQAAAHESVAQSVSVLKSIMATSEETAVALKAYEQAVEESRRQIEVEREQYFTEQASLLEKLQGLAATQCSNTDAERAALEDCASRLRLATQTMDHHLQEEAAWLAQQEATYQHSRNEWEREYRRWQQLVQQERQTAEERFHEALTGLQESLQLLELEERDVAVEQATLQRTFADFEAAAQREIEALHRRAADVQSRSAALSEMQTRLAEQKDATAEARRQLTMAQQQLEEEKADLRGDEERLRDMAEALRVARMRTALRSTIISGNRNNHNNIQLLRNGQAYLSEDDGTVGNTQGISSDGNDMQICDRKGQPQLPLSSGDAKGLSNVAAPSDAVPTAGGAVVEKQKKHRHRSDPRRLPNKIFRELNDQLKHLAAGGGGGAGEAFVPTMHWTDPAYPAVAVHQQVQQQQHQHHKSHRSRARSAGQQQHQQQQQKSNRMRNAPSPTNDVPPPLAAPPLSLRRERLVRLRQKPSPTPQEQQRQQEKPIQLGALQQHVHHVDPSSLPLTSESSPSFSLCGDCDWSPSANTFTNLVDFSDADTTSKSIR